MIDIKDSGQSVYFDHQDTQVDTFSLLEREVIKLKISSKKFEDVLTEMNKFFIDNIKKLNQRIEFLEWKDSLSFYKKLIYFFFPKKMIKDYEGKRN